MESSKNKTYDKFIDQNISLINEELSKISYELEKIEQDYIPIESYYNKIKEQGIKMMQLTNKQIKEYQCIHKKQYGKKLSLEEASKSAYNLIGFFELLLKIDRRVNKQNYNKITK